MIGHGIELEIPSPFSIMWIVDAAFAFERVNVMNFYECLVHFVAQGHQEVFRQDEFMSRAVRVRHNGRLAVVVNALLVQYD